MIGDGNFGWWWGEAEDSGFFGPFETRDAAIEAGRGECDGSFWIYQADKAVPRVDIFSADDVLERLAEHNETCLNEDGELFVNGPDADAPADLERSLTQAVANWVLRSRLAAYGFGTILEREEIKEDHRS